MEEGFKTYKRKFRNSLEPVMVMLIHRKSKISFDQWNDLVTRTKASIINNPVEFLGSGLPDQNSVKDIIEILFDEFLLQTSTR
jgi:hypothetical protein